MATIKCHREHEIAAGHRVFGHENLCSRLHGHAYVVTFYCESEQLDKVGRVIDFSVIKNTLCQWLEDNWDHKTLLWEKDPLCKKILSIAPDDVFVCPFNPTAENMAEYLVEQVGRRLLGNTEVTLTSCNVQETRKCGVIYHVESK